MRPRTRYLTLLAALCGGLLILGACVSVNEMLFGAVETEAQEAYQEKAEYAYVAIPAQEEWARLDAKVDEIQGAIQTASAAPT